MEVLDLAEKVAASYDPGDVPPPPPRDVHDSVPATQVAVGSLPISSIRKDGQTQHRVATDPNVVAEYAALMREGVAFPAITVWWDGNDYWLSAGFQRVAAAESAGCTQIAAEVRHGTQSDAQWDSYAANSVHGLRRTEADTRAVIQRALLHANAATLSNVQIAKHLHIPETTVRRWRQKLSPPSGEDRVRVVTRGETTYTLTTTNIGKKDGERRTRPRRDLGAELAEMKEKGSPTARRLLNIIGHWTVGEATPRECLEAIERFVRHWDAPGETIGGDRDEGLFGARSGRPGSSPLRRSRESGAQ